MASIKELYSRARGWGYGRMVSAISAITYPLVENFPDAFWRWLAAGSMKRERARNSKPGKVR